MIELELRRWFLWSEENRKTQTKTLEAQERTNSNSTHIKHQIREEINACFSFVFLYFSTTCSTCFHVFVFQILVKEPKDFQEKVPCGGCRLSCDYRLDDCGHACTLPCHPYDQQHKKFRYLNRVTNVVSTINCNVSIIVRTSKWWLHWSYFIFYSSFCCLLRHYSRLPLVTVAVVPQALTIN